MPDNSNYIFSWKANRSVNYPIISALFGFILSTILLKTCSNKVAYHEIYLQNKNSLVSDIIKNRNDNLIKLLSNLKQYRNVDSNDENDGEKLRLKDSFSSAQKYFFSSKTELVNLYSNADTSLEYFLSYIKVNRNQLKNKIDELKSSIDTVQLDILVKDSLIPIYNDSFFFQDSLSHLTKSNKLIIARSNESSLIDFFSNHPTYAFWYLISVAQMTLWFLLLPIIYGAAIKTNEIKDKKAITNDIYDKKKDFVYSWKWGLIFSIIPVLTMVSFLLILFLQIKDKEVITDGYFLDNFRSTMFLYGMLGYLTATYCFSIYLFLSNKLEILDKHQDNFDDKDDAYKKLTSIFQFTFLCSAVILSVFILWAGVLFNAINNAEAMKFYSLLSGKPFLNYDLIYLIGLLHSLLLLMFYVPTRIRFNNLKLTKETQESIAKDPNTNKLWTGLTGTLSTILLTASPLLVSFIQNLINLFSS